MATNILESQIQKSILDYLKLRKVIRFKHRNVGIYKKATNSYIPLAEDEVGISDIIGCFPQNSKLPGRILAIEVKRPGGKPTPSQLDFIERINNSGGVAFVAYSLDDVINKLATYL